MSQHTFISARRDGESELENDEGPLAKPCDKGEVMNREDLIDELSSLMKVDYDAIQAYNQAIDEIDVPSIRNQLVQFRDDHERHIDNLSALLHAMDAEPPERLSGIKTFFIEGFTAIRSMTGIEGALKAMESNEKTTNKSYAQALEKDLPADIRTQVQENYEDEERHLQYISQALSGKIWEPSESYFS